MTEWVELTCRLPVFFTTGDASIRALFEPARGHISDQATFLTAVTRYLQKHPDLMEPWQTYSDDKRSSPSPYLDSRRQPAEVGFYDPGTMHDVRHHTDRIDACADFIYREAAWVLSGERRW